MRSRPRRPYESISFKNFKIATFVNKSYTLLILVPRTVRQTFYNVNNVYDLFTNVYDLFANVYDLFTNVYDLWSVLLLEETRVPGENHQPVARH
jgi:hypothetical protein